MSEAESGPATCEMPRYKSHKTVWALEISAVGEPLNGFRSVAFAEPGYQGMCLAEEMFSRYVPAPGDFMVQYADGYRSFSPRKAFLDGYTRE